MSASGALYWYLAMFQALEGTVAQARASAEKAYSLMPWDTLRRASLLDWRGARAMRRARNRCSRSWRQGAALGWAAYHLVRLEFDQAAEWTAKAIEERDPGVLMLLPYMRTSSRWPALAKMLNLPEVAP